MTGYRIKRKEGITGKGVKKINKEQTEDKNRDRLKVKDTPKRVCEN